jgi:2'-5' RNA ligase
VRFSGLAGEEVVVTEGAGTTAVLLCVPEAEPLVHAWRSTGDPSAARGVPAHVTLLAPFLPATAVDAGVLAELEWFFAGIDAFELRFAELGCFESDGVVYLEPAGDSLDELAEALARRWPEAPPYGGRHAQPHPHLTVVHTADDALRTRAQAAVERGLPLQARAEQAALWVCDDEGRWGEAAVFPFGPGE